MQEYVKQESKFLSINGRALLDIDARRAGHPQSRIRIWQGADR